MVALFTAPAPHGYLYVGLRVDPPRGVPFVRGSAKRAEMIARCAALAETLSALDEVVTATVHEAVLIPPARGGPRFDVLVLVRTTTPEAVPAVEAAFQALDADL